MEKITPTKIEKLTSKVGVIYYRVFWSANPYRYCLVYDRVDEMDVFKWAMSPMGQKRLKAEKVYYDAK